MMNASHRAPGSPEHADVLSPLGAGHDVHARMFAVLTGCLLGDEEGGELREVPGIGIDELGFAMRYGYYAHACQVSLPEVLRAQLEASA